MPETFDTTSTRAFNPHRVQPRDRDMPHPRTYSERILRVAAALGLAAALTAPAAWPASIGDINGDGKDDILLRSNDGRWLYNAMDGRRRIRDLSGFADLPSDWAWRYQGMGDFDGDGDDDVLLRHDNGRWYVYVMDGRDAPDEGVRLVMYANADWQLAAIGDLNGDGTDDVLLRHRSNGRWYYYPVQDGAVAERPRLCRPLPPPGLATPGCWRPQRRRPRRCPPTPCRRALVVLPDERQAQCRGGTRDRPDRDGCGLADRRGRRLRRHGRRRDPAPAHRRALATLRDGRSDAHCGRPRRGADHAQRRLRLRRHRRLERRRQRRRAPAPRQRPLVLLPDGRPRLHRGTGYDQRDRPASLEHGRPRHGLGTGRVLRRRRHRPVRPTRVQRAIQGLLRRATNRSRRRRQPLPRQAGQHVGREQLATVVEPRHVPVVRRDRGRRPGVLRHAGLLRPAADVRDDAFGQAQGPVPLHAGHCGVPRPGVHGSGRSGLRREFRGARRTTTA